ncbi:kinase-like protein [Poronia punctata]|nr:kinase-like protein [Poronia punctata]
MSSSSKPESPIIKSEPTTPEPWLQAAEIEGERVGQERRRNRKVADPDMWYKLYPVSDPPVIPRQHLKYLDPNLLSKRPGACVRLQDLGYISKHGWDVQQNEEEALHLVRKHTSIPVPEVHISSYSTSKSGDRTSTILMEYIQGSPLDVVWDTLDDASKKRACTQVWSFVNQLRNIPKPPELSHLYQCCADGSPSKNVLIEDTVSPPRPLLDDNALRNRIYEQYLLHCGTLHRHDLQELLPHSSKSVFTHDNLAPKNILVDEDGTITGIVGWEWAGWYPDYWEYAMTQKQWVTPDWMDWMDRTRPQDWDITGIYKANKVLF